MYIYIYVCIEGCTSTHLYTGNVNKNLCRIELHNRDKMSSKVVGLQLQLQRKNLEMTSSRHFRFFSSIFWSAHESLTSDIYIYMYIYIYIFVFFSYICMQKKHLARVVLCVYICIYIHI